MLSTTLFRAEREEKHFPCEKFFPTFSRAFLKLEGGLPLAEAATLIELCFWHNTDPIGLPLELKKNQFC